MWPKLRSHLESFSKTCCTCQLFKKQRQKYGHFLPPSKEAEELSWSCVNVDLIGPYVVLTPTATHTLCALTMIDPVTGWFEVIAIRDKNAHTVMEAFNNTWLSRYPPRPQYIGFDNGSEFKAHFKPGQLVFGRDMLLPTQLKTDWARIRQRKQDIIDANNKKEIPKDSNTSTV